MVTSSLGGRASRDLTCSAGDRALSPRMLVTMLKAISATGGGRGWMSGEPARAMRRVKRGVGD